MTKAALEKHLRANPLAKRHAGLIKDTLKTIENLRKSGIVEAGYTLAPAFGGTKTPVDNPTRKLPKSKMTYCA